MELKIVCYNIHSGKNLFYRPTLDSIIEFLREQAPDIVSLQEVHNNSKQGWQFNQIKEALAMNGDFGGNVKIGDGMYGNATLTRFPLIQSKNIPLPSQKEQRGVLCSTIDIKGRTIEVLNTHLGLGKKERESQLEHLAMLLDKSSLLHILMGDFNTVVTIPFPDMMDLGKKAGKESLPTIFPLKKRIDYIYASSSFHLSSYEVIPVTHSDHYPITSVIGLSK
ncbi:endonuclease/exonuclease/phosphatase family protein [Ammoniphilus sp. 3BR4]|uniref:endonuclease/exonuclease/phosphatase family protein n=1 Tax=Ammoniphilus sp. 3BR4 TaxID=3158265 RepID=UPI0034655722